MQISLELGPELTKAVSDLTAAGRALRKAVSDGLADGVVETGRHIAAEYLTGQSLRVRTGNLRKAVKGWMASDLDGVVGVTDESAVDHYKYLLGDETVVIRPKKGRFLTIPLPEALTGAGVLKAEYAGGLKNIAGGFFLRSKTKPGQLIFGKHAGKTKRSKFLPLFTLVPQVTIQGTGALADGVLENADSISEKITDRIGGLL